MTSVSFFRSSLLRETTSVPITETRPLRFASSRYRGKRWRRRRRRKGRNLLQICGTYRVRIYLWSRLNEQVLKRKRDRFSRSNYRSVIFDDGPARASASERSSFRRAGTSGKFTRKLRGTSLSKRETSVPRYLRPGVIKEQPVLEHAK